MSANDATELRYSAKSGGRRRSAAHGTGGVPLALRNVLAHPMRLFRSASGIAFAVMLMLIELGFQNGFVDSAVSVIRAFDADIVLISSMKYQFAKKAAFPRRQLYQARAVPGVASVRPIYANWTQSVWKNPVTHATFALQLFAFDPDQPVFLIPAVTRNLAALRQPDTVMTDRRARAIVGRGRPGEETELARTRVRIVGLFSLGPDFYSDGTLIMSDRNFMKILGGMAAEPTLPDPEFGIVKVLPGADVQTVQQALRAALPDDVKVLTKQQLIDQEVKFQSQVSGVGPIFGAGVIIGFVVGMMITYQILFTDISDQLPQYATLKAIGYENRYLVKVVLQQAALYALVGYVPAWLMAVALYRILGDIALLPLEMTVKLTVLSFGLTAVMCVGAALVAFRRVAAADPAEVF